MSLFKRGSTWWIYLVHNGRRIRRSSRTDDKKRAQQAHDELKAQLWKIKPGGRTFYGALDAWRTAQQRDPADVYRLKKLKKEYADRPLHAVTAESLEAALPAKTPGTFNRYANLVTAALNLAQRRGWLDATPAIERRKTVPGRIRWLTPAEWKRLQGKLPDHLRPLAEFALATGLRQHNVTHLEWSQIDLKRRVAWIHADQAKAGKPIGLPLSDAACAILATQRGQNKQWVFPYKGKPIGKIKTAWRRALKRAKIAGFTWHDLRHTWASWHIQNGTPLPVLKELGGWASMAMVSKYAHLAPEHLRAYANAPSRNLRHNSKATARKAA